MMFRSYNNTSKYSLRDYVTMAISSHVKEENCILIGCDDVLSSKSLHPV